MVVIGYIVVKVVTSTLVFGFGKDEVVIGGGMLEKN